MASLKNHRPFNSKAGDQRLDTADLAFVPGLDWQRKLYFFRFENQGLVLDQTCDALL